MSAAPDFIDLGPPSSKPPKAGPPATISLGDSPAVKPKENASPPGFVGRSVDAVKSVLESSLKSPKDVAVGGTKALTRGALEMSEMALAGIGGLATAALGKGFFSGKEAVEAYGKHVKNFSAMITGVNLSPANKEQESMEKLLAILPDGIQSAGDTVYEKTGSALAGAGTQALLTLLTLKPGIAGKVAGKVKSAEAPISPVFDELATTQPEAAEAIAEHVGQADKATAKYMQSRIQKFKDASDIELDKIGKAAAKANLESLMPPKMAEVIKGLPKKPAELTPGKMLEGKPAATQEQISAGIRSTVKEVQEALNEKPKALAIVGNKIYKKDGTVKAVPKELEQKPWTDADQLGTSEQRPANDGPEIVYFNSGVPVTRESVEAAFRVSKEQLERIPGVKIANGKLAQYAEEVILNINPEALGPEAKRAAATVAKAMSEQIQSDSSHYTKAQERRTFWVQRSDLARPFLKGAEQGKKFKDSMLEQTRLAYKDWNKEIAEQDRGNGFEYEEQDHYMAHIFEDGKGAVNFLKRKYGAKWGDPGFIKDRTFDLYEEARNAGFTPKFENPEDIMLARQHASDVAGMKVQVLKDLHAQGLAFKVDKQGAPAPESFPSVQRRSPNGDWYWVHKNAEAVLHNAFDSQGLWSRQGFVGDAFRGTMALKNRIVPLKLALSLFHPIHVATIDNATGMVRASKELLSGELGPLSWAKQMLDSARYKGFFDNPRQGGRLLKVWQGKIADTELTNADKQSLQYMFEGGMIPEMSAQYRTNAVQNFKDAVAKRSLTTPFHLVDAIISKTQGLMFEKWIPSLKVASYLKDVQTALKTNPELVSKPFDRQLAFRKLAKSVDNRYGEMAYGTLFWNKWIKDVAVGTTLSLGWQMGFIREYGGGAMDVGQAIMKPGELAGKVKEGLLDRPLFVAFYTTQALLYGGLMTYAFTKKAPEQLIDYVYPQTGDVGPDGKPSRATTMFYPREFFAIHKHMENEGVVQGLKKTVEAKASGMIGMITDWSVGVNDFGQEIRDSDDPAFKQLQQTLAYSLGYLEPIAVEALMKDTSGNIAKSAALAFTGFGPAPKYITETKTEAHVKDAYDKYVRPKQTPYDKFLYSKDVKKLQEAYKKDDPKYDDMLDKAQDTYDLKASDIRRLEKQFRKDDDFDIQLYMFSRLEWQQQKHLLDKMSPEERDRYLPKANKKHLRNSYEPPEETAK